MKRTCLSILAISLFGGLALPESGFAQTNSVATQTSVARFDAAEALRTSATGKADLEQSLAMHQALVGEGYLRSMVPVADLLQDLDRPLESLLTWERAAAFGNSYAAVRLATGHIEGVFGPASDLETGVRQLKVLATDPTNERAVFALADLYAEGLGVPQDGRRALALFSELASGGSASAMSRAGDLYLGELLGKPNPEAAIAAYSSAIANGRDDDVVNLAEAYILAGRSDEAVALMDKAVGLGIERAEIARARWHLDGDFGPASQPTLGAEYLIEAVTQGNVEAARVASYEYVDNPQLMSGLDLEKMIEVLEGAARDGNGSAVRALARAYRRLDTVIQAARVRHRAVIDTFGGLLDEDARVVEQIYAAYDPRNHLESSRQAASILETVHGAPFIDGMMELRSIERTAFVYALQGELTELGYFRGARNGRLTSRTISSVMEFCRDVGIIDMCRNGPIVREVSEAIVTAIADRKS